MKKHILLLSTGLVLSSAVFAQKAKLNSANRFLETITETTPANEASSLIEKAKTDINLAIEDEKTKSLADVWYSRAKIYAKSASLNNNNAQDIETASQSLKKAAELNPKISAKEDYTYLVLELGLNNYNIGQTKFQSQNYKEAYNNFSNAITLFGETPSADMKKAYPNIDTVHTYTRIYQGLSAYHNDDLTNAEAVNAKLLNNPIAPKDQIIGQLIEIAIKKGDKAKQLEYIKLGRKEFPTNENFTAAETNYYIDNKLTDELIANLTASASKEPNNPQYPFNLGLVYSDLASNKETPRDKAKEYETKAEESYKKALELAGDNPIFNQQLAIYYYNKGVDLQKAAAKLSANKNTVAQANAILEQRDVLFKKAQTIFEKAAKGFADQKNKVGLDASETESYYTTLQALGRIYNTLGADQKKQTEILNIMKTLK